MLRTLCNLVISLSGGSRSVWQSVQSCATDAFHTMCRLSHLCKMNINSVVSSFNCRWISMFSMLKTRLSTTTMPPTCQSPFTTGLPNSLKLRSYICNVHMQILNQHCKCIALKCWRTRRREWQMQLLKDRELWRRQQGAERSFWRNKQPQSHWMLLWSQELPSDNLFNVFKIGIFQYY